jgi:AraC-like DNA-binding protein
MSERSDVGVVYTEHADLRATPVASVWSYETQTRGRHRRPVERDPIGNYVYWLEPSDPLLNTILPGTEISVVVNFGDRWAAGRSLATSALLPRVAVVGPVTQTRILRIGARVLAIGAVLPATHGQRAFGVPPAHLVDQIVPLDDLWNRSEVEVLFESLSALPLRSRLSALCRVLVTRIAGSFDRVGHAASRAIAIRGGRVSIEEMAGRYGSTRQQFARRFSTATGMTPKMFARVTRFQFLIHALLSTDVSEWASVAANVGFYDQSHMINEFREFAGASPTVFFQPHGDTADAPNLQRRGRPSEWQSVK